MALPEVAACVASGALSSFPAQKKRVQLCLHEGYAPMLKGMMMLTVAGAGCYGFIHVAAPNLFQLVPVKASCAPTSTLCDKDALAAP